MTITRIGIPAPAQVNTRPSGRYKIQAPDAPVGSILRVTTRDGLFRFVKKHSDELLLDLDLCTVDFVDWDFANRAEVELFGFQKRLNEYADLVELHGAPAFMVSIRSLPNREQLLLAVAEELGIRGKQGRREQVLAFAE